MVVFVSNKEKALGGTDFVFESFDGLSLVCVVVLVVKRQVFDLHLFESELRRRQLYHGVRQREIEGILVKAAEDNGDLVLAHYVLL
jgi:hypothetical protein